MNVEKSVYITPLCEQMSLEQERNILSATVEGSTKDIEYDETL